MKSRLAELARGVVIWVVHVLDCLCPKQEKIVIRGIPDLEDQCIAVLMGLSRRKYPGRIIWLMRSEWGRIPSFAERYGLEGLHLRGCSSASLPALYHFITARMVFSTHGTYSQGEWGNYRPPRRKTVVNLWHGMPIKAIWRLLPKPEDPPFADVLPVTSARYQQIMETASGMKPGSLWICGLPRNDLLSYRSVQAEASIRELVDDCRWLLYLPTYRKSVHGCSTVDGCEQDSAVGMSAAELRKLDAWLRDHGMKLVVKPHPLSVHAAARSEPVTANIMLIGEEWLMDHQLTLYVVAGYSTGLITDLSSIAIDYLLLDRPVFIYFPDREQYVHGRGLVVDNLEDHLPGEICIDVEALLARMDAFLRGDNAASERRRRLRTELHAYPAGSATDRLLDALGVRPHPPGAAGETPIRPALDQARGGDVSGSP